MLLFAEDLESAEREAARDETKVEHFTLYWFKSGKRFLCEQGRLLKRKGSGGIERKREYFSQTRIMPVAAEIAGDEITIRGPKGVRTYSRIEIELKEKLRKRAEKERSE